MGEDTIRPGQRRYIPSRFPGTSGDAAPEEQDVEGHRVAPTAAGDGDQPGPLTVSDPDELLRKLPDDSPHGEG